jgi:Arc/MetJ-type ribon-helix-helix transcriptional regulator
MRKKKERLTVTVDGALLRAANDAVKAGRASSVSAWVNLALEQQAAREQRLRAMADAIAAYEAVHGVISDEEIAKQRRSDRRNAMLVEAAPPKRPQNQKKRRSAA